MDELPPLPEPGFQSPEDRQAIARRFILQARHYLEQRDRLQAGEKAWGAIAHNLKLIGEQRGWSHGSHQQIENIARQIVIEFQDARLGQAISDVFHNGHRNFYENQTTFDEMRDTIESAENAMPTLEALQREAPCPFTITTNQEMRRLRALTGNDSLQIGDISPAGFSLKHAPNGGGNSTSDGNISE